MPDLPQVIKDRNELMAELINPEGLPIATPTPTPTPQPPTGGGLGQLLARLLGVK